MEAILNLYKGCEDVEPYKSYVCKRLLLKVSKKVGALSSKVKGASPEEQERITLEILKTIFPDFKDEEFEDVDPVEYMKFVEQIMQETNEIMENAQKN